MGALINCVELQESADNCTAMGTLAVSPPTEPRAEPGRGRGHDLGRGQVWDPSHTRAFLAPEFLGRLLVSCTRSFARHLETNRASDDHEEETSDSPSVPSKDRDGRNKDWVDNRNHDNVKGNNDSTATLACPSAPAVGGGGMERNHQRQEEDDEEMSHAEGADLVLGGHCALLLGLLIRGQEEIRCGFGVIVCCREPSITVDACTSTVPLCAFLFSTSGVILLLTHPGLRLKPALLILTSIRRLCRRRHGCHLRKHIFCRRNLCHMLV